MTEHNVKTIGRYVIEREIGRGGMAIVYQAYDPHLDRPVAIKLIRKDAFTGDQLKTLPERFRREARALAKLDHPNIVKVMDYGEHDGDTYLVMEFVKGRTLKDVRKPLRVETAVRLLRPIAEALDYVHDQGILHRDVKPSNLMITPKEKVMLTDFGIAKWLENENDQFTLTGTGIGIGTPEYMAPEQGLGKKTDERADLYSLAVVFYELITGQKPFLGETPLEVLTKQATEPFPDPRQFVPELNESVTHFFNLALAKKPTDRYSSMKDFIRDMDGLRLQSLAQASVTGTTGIRSAPPNEGTTESSVRLGKTDIRKIRAAADALNTPAADPKQDSSAIKREKRRSPWLIPVFAGLAVIAVVAALWLAGDRSGGKSTLTVERTPIAYSSDTPDLTAVASYLLTGTAEAQSQSNTESAAFDKIRIAQETSSTESQRQMAESSAIETEIAATVEAVLKNTETAARSILLMGPAETQFQSNTESAAFDKTRIAQETTATALQQQSAELAAIVAGMTATGEITTKEAETDSPYTAIQVGDFIPFGRYEQDGNWKNGPDTIEWQVLEISDGNALLISRYGLEMKYYNKDFISVTWADCTLRKWLNQDFYIHAFDENEREQVLTSHLINDDNPDYGTAGGMETDDHVFILSYTEAMKYFKNDKDRRVKPSHKIGVTDYANNAHWIDAEGYIRWLIRTPGRIQNYVSGVNSNGSISTGYFNRVSNGDTGVATAIIRPAIRIELKNRQFETTDSVEKLSSEAGTPEPVITETIESEQPEKNSETQPVKIDNPYAGVKIGDIIEFGHYEQDNDLNNGTEPIEWQVLEVSDDHTATLISLYGLDAREYHGGGNITWEKSQIRNWLNSSFYNSSFSDLERNRIKLSHLSNPDNPDFASDGGNDTEDHVFLLSLEEAKQLFADNEARKLKPTAYALANKVWTNVNSCWWLRTPGNFQYYVSTVLFDGSINSYGFSALPVGNIYHITKYNYSFTSYGNYYCAVRPSITISLSEENFETDELSDMSPLETVEPVSNIAAEPEQPEIFPETQPAEAIQAYTDIKVGDIIEFGHYEQDNDLSNGAEPIEWIALEVSDSTATLISHYGLEALTFNNYVSSNPSWENSTIRKWLNYDFLESAFDIDERWLIKTNRTTYTAGSNNTDDRVYLLNEYELESLIGKINDRQLTPTDFVKAKGLDTDENGHVSWWLRSTGSSYSILAVYPKGLINSDGLYASWRKAAVRPVIQIYLSSEIKSTAVPPARLKETEAALKLTATARAAESMIGETLVFGRYEQDNNLENGPEQIEWEVLEIEDNTATLISKYGLDSVPYNEKLANVSWENCSLRAWLNGEFYEQAFNENEKSSIRIESIPNESRKIEIGRTPVAYWWGTRWQMDYQHDISNGKNTEESVYVLDIKEYYKYSFSYSGPTAYAESKNLKKNRWGGTQWWLRTRVADKNNAFTNLIEHEGMSVNSQGILIRPVIRINLDSIKN